MDVLCETDGCENEATTRYSWPWGAEGFVCDGHRVHIEQKAEQLGRKVMCSSLFPETPAVPAPDSADLLEQLSQLNARYEELQTSYSDAQQQIIKLTNELGRLKRGSAFAPQQPADEKPAELEPTTHAGRKKHA